MLQLSTQQGTAYGLTQAEMAVLVFVYYSQSTHCSIITDNLVFLGGTFSDFILARSPGDVSFAFKSTDRYREATLDQIRWVELRRVYRQGVAYYNLAHPAVALEYANRPSVDFQFDWLPGACPSAWRHLIGFNTGFSLGL